MTAEDMAALYEKGETLQQIAVKAGCCNTTVWNRLKALGVKTRPRGSRADMKQRTARAKMMRRQGMTFAAIGKELGMSSQGAWQLVRRAVAGSLVLLALLVTVGWSWPTLPDHWPEVKSGGSSTADPPVRRSISWPNLWWWWVP